VPSDDFGRLGSRPFESYLFHMLMKGETFVMTPRRAAFGTAVLALILTFPVFISACSKKDAGATDKGPVVAVVNGEKITQAEVDRLVQIIQERGVIPPDSVAKGATLDEKQWNYAVDQLVERSLILEDAKKRGVTPDTMQVNQTLSQYKAQLKGQFPDSVITSETEAEMRRDLTDYMLINKYFQETVVNQLAAVTDDEAQSFMAKNPQHFGEQEQVSVRHILIQVPPGSGDMAKADSLKKAQGVLARAKKGEDFAELARKYSQDPGSAANGGSYTFGRGRMVPQFESAAFSMAPGQISDIVETEFGYHIIKLEGKGSAPGATIEEARQAVHGEKANAAVAQRIKDLRAAAKIEIKEKKG
jgi:parvulin-like peptidyl-prolyl isomerase